MKIFGLEKLSLVDYQDYACAVIFTGGCNFRCPFCHNSGLVDKSVSPINVEEVIEFLTKRKSLLDAVCISGGEPTLESGLIEFVKEIKELGYMVKLDTNGTNPEVLEQLINENLIDYVAMDYKNSSKNYPMTTGVANIDINKITKSVDILKNGKVDYEFRTTIVAEFHNEDSIRDMATELSGAKKLFLQKFVENENCISKGLTPVTKDVAEDWKNILAYNIKEVNLRGYV